MDVLCVGMYRACSTWQYDVAAHLVERHRGGRRLGFVLGEEYAGVGQAFQPDSSVARQAGKPDLPAEGPPWRVLKSHDGHDDFAAALDARRAVALYAHRDLRDVAFSLAHRFGAPFEVVHGVNRLLHACLRNDAFWRARPGVLTQRYEDVLADPARAVAQIAAHLGIELAEGEDAELAAEYSLDANRRRTAEVRERLRRAGVEPGEARTACYDPQTLLHHNHIRDGGRGWREEATPAQLVFLAAVCTDWLLANGYESDPDWLTRALRERGWDGGQIAACWLEQERRLQQDGPREQVLQATLDRVQAVLAKSHESNAALTRELSEARGHAEGLEGLTAGLHGIIADLTARLAHAREVAHGLNERLEEIERLGPVALGVARRVHGLSVSHPRLARVARRWIVPG